MTSLKCVHAMTLGADDMSANRRSVAHSRPTPSGVSVPFPNSSMMHSDLPARLDCYRTSSVYSHSLTLNQTRWRAQWRECWGQRHRPVAERSMEAIWLRSSMNCDCPRAVASWLAMRVKIRSVSPTMACCTYSMAALVRASTHRRHARDALLTTHASSGLMVAAPSHSLQPSATFHDAIMCWLQ